MNLNLRDNDPLAAITKRRAEMAKEQMSLERSKWDKLSGEHVAVIIIIKLVCSMIAIMTASICVCNAVTTSVKAITDSNLKTVQKNLEENVANLDTLNKEMSKQLATEIKLVTPPLVNLYKSEDSPVQVPYRYEYKTEVTK